MRKALAVGLVAAVLVTAACSQAHSESGGPTISRNYSVGGFTAIEVAGPYAVEVQTGGNPSVSASGPEKMIEHMIVEVKGDRLLIHPQEQSGFFRHGWSFSGGTVHVTVSVPQLQGAAIAGSGDLQVNAVKGAAFEGSVGGSGNLGVGQLDVQTLKLAIGGSGGIKAGNGRAQKVDYAISGSGDIDARGVQAETASVSIAGSGSVAAHASGTAEVNMLGSGDVELIGGAKCSINKHGSGDVRCS